MVNDGIGIFTDVDMLSNILVKLTTLYIGNFKLDSR